MRLLAEIEAEFWKFIDRLGQALDEKRTGFSEYEAGDFLTAQGRMECDGPDAAQLLAEAEAENEVFEPARFCAKCDEQVGFLSSRDWCDGCEEAASIGEHPDIDPQAVIGKRRDWSGIGSPAQTPAPPGGENSPPVPRPSPTAAPAGPPPPPNSSPPRPTSLTSGPGNSAGDPASTTSAR